MVDTYIMISIYSKSCTNIKLLFGYV